MYPLITLETYSDMFVGEKENENYDNELREFTVPLSWLRDEFDTDNFGVESFLDFLLIEYTWDDTWFLYERAVADKVIVSEKIIGR